MDVGGREAVAFTARQVELDLQAEQAERVQTEKRKNRNFAQVYAAGWQRIRELADASPACVKLYALLAEHMGTNGAVVASQAHLAELLGVTDRTIRNLSKTLEESGALARIRVGTGTYAYALNPSEVWRSWETTKSGAVFNTRTLIDSKAAREGHAKIHAMLTKEKETEEDKSD